MYVWRGVYECAWLHTIPRVCRPEDNLWELVLFSTMWVSGIERKLSGLVAGNFTPWSILTACKNFLNATSPGCSYDLTAISIGYPQLF